MRSSLAAVLFSLVLANLPAATGAAEYTVDGAHTSVVFSVGHLGYSYTFGMFRKASGTVDFDAARGGGHRFNLLVEVASIDTGNEQRDKHLLAEDFFDAAQFPTITFTGAADQGSTDEHGRVTYQVTGKLTMHGVTRDVTLPIRLLNAGAGHDGKPRAGFHCQTTIKRSDYGMTTTLGPISDQIGVTFSFEAAGN